MSAEPFAPVDEIGLSTLQNISGATRFNDWLFESIELYIKGKTLEIGSGIGNISSVFIDRGLPLYLSDYSQEYGLLLKNKFSSEPLVRDIYKIDLADKEFEITYAHLLGNFDTVFSLNVLEHIADDHLAVENCYKLLSPGGHLILLTPAGQRLYNGFDKSLGHFRRYNRRTIYQLLSAHFQVIKIWNFNLAGIFGWFLFGSVLRRKIIAKGQMTAFEKFVPLFRVADKITGNRIGLSVIGIGKKQASQ